MPLVSYRNQWDEELGPEQHCPHCGNELSGYRTLKLGVDDEDEADEVEEEEDIDWEEEKAYKAKREAALGDIIGIKAVQPRSART